MATYVIGDIHGCYKTLCRLFDSLEFDVKKDRLWLTGDLVNRGPRSLEVLRWACEWSDDLGERMVVVLGNHDIHLLALDAGYGQRRHVESFQEVLEAPDRKALLKWLRRRPFLHREKQTLLVHAGLDPRWSVKKAVRKARRLEKCFHRARDLASFFEPSANETTLGLRRDARVLTSIRTCTKSGRLCDHTGPPATAPRGCLPWFEAPGRRSREVTIIAGNWASLGIEIKKRFIGLDSGCVYGGKLTAIRLEDRRLYSRGNRD